MRSRFVQLGYLLAFLAVIPLVFAAPGGDRGRGGRGGGGGGGRKGGGRTPSMSRSKGQSQRKANRSRGGSRKKSKPSNRPSGNRPNRGNRPDRPSGANRSGGINRPSGGSNLTGGGGGGSNRPNRQNNRPGQKRPHDRNRYKNQKKRNRDRARKVNDRQKRRHRGNRDWYRRDNRWRNYAYWGSTPYWGYVSNWLPYSWDYPVYYDQGDVTVEITDYTAQDDLYEETTLPTQVYGDWLPLGLFVAAATVEEAAYSNLYIQLAVNKSGEIAGTYYNAGTDRTEQLVGVVDPTTQQVAFQLTSRPDGPLVVTGLYNLTQEVTPVRIFFSSGIEQEWVLVRLEDEQGF